MGKGLIGKILKPKQHVYSAGENKIEDKNADENPGYTQWRFDNKKMDDNASNLAEFKKIKADKKSNSLEGSPLGGAYDNPRFVDTESGQTAQNIASKALLEGAVKKFNDPSIKSKRQAKRAKRLDNRAERRDTRFRNKNEVKQSNTLIADIKSNPENIKGRKEMSKSFNESVRKPFYEKTDKLKERALKIQGKSDANKMIADEKAKYAGLTANQVRLARESERKNNNNNNSKVSMFSSMIKKPETTLQRFTRTGKTSQQE